MENGSSSEKKYVQIALTLFQFVTKMSLILGDTEVSMYP